MRAAEGVFIGFGLASQAVLVAFFAARRVSPRRAFMIGNAAYGFAALGLPVGLVLLVDGQDPTFAVGPLLMALWAVFGEVVDVWRPRPWRGPPVEWNVLVPFVTAYFFAQMFLWWPLWKLAPEAWAVFLVLFALNTFLNLQGHARPGSRNP